MGDLLEELQLSSRHSCTPHLYHFLFPSLISSEPVSVIPAEGCSHPDYFIQGLRTIQDMVLESNLNVTFTRLFRKLEKMKQECTDRFILLRLQCGNDVISPVTFQTQLITLFQELNNVQS
ncbi:hypothetical protein PAMP_022919 [Pampus punctatissimus]